MLERPLTPTVRETNASLKPLHEDGPFPLPYLSKRFAAYPQRQQPAGIILAVL